MEYQSLKFIGLYGIWLWSIFFHLNVAASLIGFDSANKGMREIQEIIFV